MKIWSLFVALLVYTLCIQSAYSQSYYTNFNNRNGWINGWSDDIWYFMAGYAGPSNNDKCEPIGCRWMSNDPGTNWVVQQNYNWTDFSFNTNITKEDKDGIGVVFRFQNRGLYYLWFATHESYPSYGQVFITHKTIANSDNDLQHVFLYKIKNGSAELLLYDVIYAPKFNSHDLNIKAIDDTYTITYNGITNTVIDTDPILSGAVGLYGYNNHYDYFDFLNVDPIDTTPPTITLSNPFVTFEQTELTGHKWDGKPFPTVTDDIDPSPKLRTRLSSKTGTIISFPYKFSLGQTTLWWEAYDVSGNTSYAQQIVEITKDVTPPIISGVGGNITREQENSNGTLVNTTLPTAKDRGNNVAVIAHLNSINGTVISLPYTFPLGLSRIYWTAIDAYGNVAAQIQEIEIRDTTPAFLQSPSDIIQEANDAYGNIISLGNPQVFDICDASPTVSTSAPDRFRVGETFVTWLATDDSGNFSLSLQKITITDMIPPKFIDADSNNELPPSFLVPNSFESCVPVNDVPLPSVEDLGTITEDLNVNLITIDGKAVLGHECLNMSLIPYYVCYEAIDEVGNFSTACQYLAVRTPTLLFDVFSSANYHQFWWSNEPVIFDIDVTGTISQLSFQVKPAPDEMIIDQSHLTITYNKEGIYESIMVTASDDENWGRQSIYPFGIDKTPPTVDVSGLIDNFNAQNQIQNLVFGENPRIVDIIMNDNGNIASGLDSYHISLSDGQSEYVLSSGEFLKHKNTSQLYTGPMMADFFRCNEDILFLLCDDKAEVIDLQKLALLKDQLSENYILNVTVKDVAGNETSSNVSFRIFDYYHALTYTIDKITSALDSQTYSYEVEESLKIASAHLQTAQNYEAFSYHEGSYLRAEKAMTVLASKITFLPQDFFDVLIRAFFGDIDVFIESVTRYIEKDEILNLENDLEHLDTAKCYLMQARYYFSRGDHLKAMYYGRMAYEKLALQSARIHEQLVKQNQAEQEPISLNSVSNAIRNIESLLRVTRDEIIQTLSVDATNARTELEQVLDDLYQVSNTCILNLGIFNLSDYEFMNCYLLITRSAENLNKVEQSLVGTHYWKSSLAVSLFTMLNVSLYLSPTSLMKIATANDNLDETSLTYDSQLVNAMQAYQTSQLILKKGFVDSAFDVYLSAKCTMIDLYNRYYSSRNTQPNLADPKDTPLLDEQCQGGETIQNMPIVNDNPSASAGVDQIADEGQLVLLDGSKTTDPDSDAVMYRWEQTSGKKLLIDNPNQKESLFFAPYLIGHQSAEIDFTVVADDGKYGCDIDVTTIYIDNVNDAPIANAGSDTLALEATSVALDASASSDMEYDVLHFSWQQISGIPVEIVDPLSAKTFFVAPLVSASEKIPLTFEVTVADDFGGVSKDTITITIIDISASTSLKPLLCITDENPNPEDPACFIPLQACANQGVCNQCYKPCIKDFSAECDFNKIPSYENVEASCKDFLDNDCDGYADDEDSDCTCWNFSSANRDTIYNQRPTYITSDKDSWKQVLPNNFDQYRLITASDKHDVFTFEDILAYIYGGSGKIDSTQTAKDEIQTFISFISALDATAQIQLLSEKPLLKLFGFSEGYEKKFVITFPQTKSLVKLRDFLAQKLANISTDTVPNGDDTTFVLLVLAYKDNNTMLFNFGLSPKSLYDNDTNGSRTALLQLLGDGNTATGDYFVETQCLIEKINNTTQTVQRGVDFLWIEDVSGSIWQQLQTLQMAADSFALALQSYNIDWRMLVYPAYVRMKIEDFSYDRASKTWIKRSDYFYTDVNRFKQEVLYLPGRYGCSQIAPDFIVTQPASCIESPISTGRILIPQLKQAGILDPERLLVAIMATDTRDHYLHSGEETIENFIDYYQSENVLVFAVFPMQENINCAEPAGKDPKCDQEYRRLVSATGGSSANICGGSAEVKGFLDTIPQKLNKIIDVDGMVRFDDTPILSSMIIFNENVHLNYSYVQGVYFNEQDKILEYSDQTIKPQDQDRVSVFYQVWKKL